MKYPNFSEEKKLWKRGFQSVAGLDEVGRGALCGPVVACAVIINEDFKNKNFNVKDSKKLSARQREKIYKIFCKHPQVRWGIGEVKEKVIDKINILEATKLAMQKALEDLGCPADYLILDGSFSLNLDISQKSIVKGDMKVFSCALASIMAKVWRDRLMRKYHKKFPAYNFKQNKGYGTEYHIRMLQKIGPCTIHRKSFFPVSSYPPLD